MRRGDATPTPPTAKPTLMRRRFQYSSAKDTPTERTPLRPGKLRFPAPEPPPSPCSSAYQHWTWLLAIALILVIVGGLFAAGIVAGLRDPCGCTVLVEYNGTVANATGGAPLVPTTLPLVIAVIGDQGLGGRQKQVLQLIRDEGATLVMHIGDFDYQGAPKCWVNQMFDVLANQTDPGSLVADYFACFGNHDFEHGHRAAHAYGRRLREQVHPIATQCCCTGRVGG